jgi:hypothetical protein
MIVWIASAARSGNTFFRVVMHHLYGVNTYAVFNAGEVLVTAGAGGLVGHEKLPTQLKVAVESGEPEQIRVALNELEAMKELFVFKTHAFSENLFGTACRAILIVRDGRDALVSRANYRVDIRFDATALKHRIGKMTKSKSELLDRRTWVYIGKALLMAAARKGFHRRMVSRRIDRLLQGDPKHPEADWTEMNRSWLEREPQPVIVYFNDLIRDPIATVTGAVDKLGIGLVPRATSSMPSFAELKKRYPNFFRKGISGDWRNQFSSRQAELFRAKHQAMMDALKFPL